MQSSILLPMLLLPTSDYWKVQTAWISGETFSVFQLWTLEPPSWRASWWSRMSDCILIHINVYVWFTGPLIHCTASPRRVALDSNNLCFRKSQWHFCTTPVPDMKRTFFSYPTINSSIKIKSTHVEECICQYKNAAVSLYLFLIHPVNRRWVLD